jgi:hypothetical protein
MTFKQQKHLVTMATYNGTKWKSLKNTRIFTSMPLYIFPTYRITFYLYASNSNIACRTLRG